MMKKAAKPTKKPRRKPAAGEQIAAASPWRNRIVDQGVVAPGKLLKNPKNWRLHPKHQEQGLAAVLDEVGWVQRIVVNKRTGFVVDGHLRAKLAIARGEKEIPVSYVDLSDREETIVLATLDPLAALAGHDDAALKKILKTAQGKSDPVDELLGQISLDAGFFKDKPSEPKESPSPAGKIVHSCPRCKFKFSTGK
jgi:hypothetical protein